MNTKDTDSAKMPIAKAPKFIRVKRAIELFGLSEATIYRMLRRKAIKSKLLRVPGNVSGIRMILTESLNAVIMNSAE